MSDFEETCTAAVDFLRHHQADTTPHMFGDLLTHLEGVESLVRQWGGDDLLALAALGHATYGTDGFEPHILELEQRDELRRTIGPEAETLVYFYASCDRKHFYAQLTAPDTDLSDLQFRDRFTDTEVVPSADYVTRFMNLTFANECELAAASPGGAAEWTWLSEFCRETQRWASPGFICGAAKLLSEGD